MSHPRTPGRGAVGLASSAVAILIAATIGSPAAAAAADGTILNAGGATAVPGSYIVVLSNTAVAARDVSSSAQSLAAKYGGTVVRTYQHALRGFEVHLSPAAAAKLATNRSVRFVEQNHTVTIAGTQSPTPSWGLDRIDQRDLPLNNSYTYPSTTSNVHAYVIDTGTRITHQDLAGHAQSGWDFVDNDSNATDCHGHGTHVSGTVGGTSHGVAKNVTIVGVRVLNCQGSGTNAGVIAGIDWVTANAVKPAVANMSLGGAANAAVDNAVSASIGSGITYGIAAGNGNIVGTPLDACTFSPARVPAAITVGATQQSDARASFSNFGTCLDIFAPGVGITSAWATSDTATNTIGGTSMAAPHVVGAAALVLAANPTFTPQQVRDALVNSATNNKVTDPRGSPNKLLFVTSGDQPPPGNDFSVGVTPAAGSVDPGASATATVNTAITSGNAQTVNLSASGLPSGATASFNPTSVASGGSSALTISTSASTPPGTYPVTITGAGASATHTATFTLTVNGASGECTGTNDTDVPVADNTTVESPIALSGCTGNASVTSTVEAHIKHTWKGDLVVSLIAPDGTAYVLHNRTGGSTDNIDQTYTVNLSSEGRNGTWKLRVADAAALDTGTLNSWTLTL